MTTPFFCLITFKRSHLLENSVVVLGSEVFYLLVTMNDGLYDRKCGDTNVTSATCVFRSPEPVIFVKNHSSQATKICRKELGFYVFEDDLTGDLARWWYYITCATVVQQQGKRSLSRRQMRDVLAGMTDDEIEAIVQSGNQEQLRINGKRVHVAFVWPEMLKDECVRRSCL